MAITDFTIINRSLTGRSFSTVVTALTVAVGVGLMLILLGMRDAGRQAFERGYGNMHMLITRDASPLVGILNGVYYAGAPRNFITWEKYEELSTSFPWQFAIPTQLGDSYRGRPVLATEPAFFTDFEPNTGEPWRFAQGGAFQDSFEVVVGAEAARSTGLRMGEQIALTHGTPGDLENAHEHREFLYEVVGILEPTGSAHDRALFTNLTSSWILHAHDRRLADIGPDISLTTEADLIPDDRKITGIYARLFTRPGSNTTAALQQVFNMLRTDATITVAAPAQEVTNLFRIVGNIDQIILGLAAAVLVSSGIGILLALYNTMEQRRRQIAVLRVLGASRGKVFGLVITESAVLGVLGAVAGIAISLVGSRIVTGLMEARLGLVITPTLEPRTILFVVLGTIGLAAVAGLIPAISAYRTSVVRGLRPIG